MLKIVSFGKEILCPTVSDCRQRLKDNFEGEPVSLRWVKKDSGMTRNEYVSVLQQEIFETYTGKPVNFMNIKEEAGID